MGTIPRTQRLSYRQARNAVMAGLLLGLFLSGAQIAHDLLQEQKRIASTVHQVMDIVKNSAGQAAYSLDRPLAGRVIDGLLEYRSIHRGRLIDDFGRIMAERSRSVATGRLEWLVNLAFDPTKTLSASLAVKGREVGRLEVAVDWYLTTADFLDRAGLILMGGVVRNLVLAVILTLLFHATLTRPLLHLVRGLKAVEPERPGDTLLTGDLLARRDELGLLSHSVNQVLEGFDKSLTDRGRAQVELEKSEAWLRTLLSTIPHGVQEHDLSGTITYGNPALEALFGQSGESLVGRKVWELVDSSDQAERWRNYFAMQANYKPKPAPFFFQGRRRDGQILEIQADWNYRRGPGGEVIGFLSILTDVTEKRLADEKAQRQRREQLREAQEGKRRLEEAERARRELQEELARSQRSLVDAETRASLAHLAPEVAHEANTLVGIGYTASSHLDAKTREVTQLFHKGKLKRSHLESYLETAQESTGLILSNLGRGAALIRGFKHVTVDSASQELRIFDLHACLTDVLTSLGPKLKRTSHTLNLDCPEGLKILNQPGVFAQIIANLVINSLTHGFPGERAGTIGIQVIPGTDALEMRYHDDGEGLPVEDLERIFEPFYTTRRGEGGSGLGLHIVQSLVTDTLGGSIEAQGALGDGLSFLIHIPREREADHG